MIKKSTKQRTKKLLKSCLSAGIIATTILGTTVVGQAYTPICYEVEPVWDGKGSVTGIIDCEKEIDNITFGDVVLDNTDYSITENKGIKTVIISEVGMNKLSLKNGCNYLNVQFKAERETTMPITLYALDDSQTQLIIEKGEVIQIAEITNVADLSTEFSVDSENYSITEKEDEFIINFDNEYIETVNNKVFAVYCVKKGSVLLEVTKGDLGDVNCDGKVDLKDAQLSLKASLGIEDITTEISKLGDMDNDGKVALKDVRGVLNKALGIK